MPTSILGSSIFQLATLARYVLLATNCPQFKFIPSLVWPDDPVDDAYLLRTTEPIGGVRASIKVVWEKVEPCGKSTFCGLHSTPVIDFFPLSKPFSGKQWKFYDMEGNIVADPMLMLDGQPRSIPVSRLPVSITVALVSDL